MICYRDKTFCTAQCANEECPDKLTIDVIRASIDTGLDVSQDNFQETCSAFKPDSIAFDHEEKE